MAEPGTSHLDQNLTGPRLWYWHVEKLRDLLPFSESVGQHVPMFAQSDDNRKGVRGSEPGAAKPQWGLAGLTLGALLTAGGVAAALGFGQTSLLAGLVALFVLAATLSAPRVAATRAAVTVAALTTGALLLAHFGSGAPLTAGLAMAAVMFTAGVSRAGGPVVAAAGTVLGTAYFLPASLDLPAGSSIAALTTVSLIGLIAGLLLFVTVLFSGLAPPAPGERSGGAEEPRPQPLKAITKEIRSGGPGVRYALRRALLLGVAMAIYQVDNNHNVFWVMLTIFIVLEPDPSSTWAKSLQRGSGALAGSIAVGALAQVAPAEVVVAFAVVAVIVGLAFYRSNYAIYAAGVSFLVVALLGSDGGSFFGWAALRVADTAIGIAIAIVSVHVILPDRAAPQASEGASGRL